MKARWFVSLILILAVATSLGGFSAQAANEDIPDIVPIVEDNAHVNDPPQRYFPGLSSTWDLTESGRWAFYYASLRQDLSWVDTETGVEIKVADDDFPGPFWTLARDDLYLADGGVLHRIRPGSATRNAVWSFPSGWEQAQLQYLPEHRNVLIRGTTDEGSPLGHLHALDTTSGVVVELQSGLDSGFGVGVPGRNEILTRTSDGIVQVALDGTGRRVLAPSGVMNIDYGNDFAVSRDGGHVYWVENNARLMHSSTVGGTSEVVFEDPSDGLFIEAVSDEHVLFWTVPNRQVYLADNQGNSVVPILAKPNQTYQAWFSADKQHFALGDRGTLWVGSVAAPASLQQISTGFHGAIVLSPTENKAVFEASASSGPEVKSLDLVTGEVVDLVSAWLSVPSQFAIDQPRANKVRVIGTAPGNSAVGLYEIDINSNAVDRLADHPIERIGTEILTGTNGTSVFGAGGNYQPNQLYAFVDLGRFIDDQGTFEADIEAIAASGVTKGCNPPSNNRFCPKDEVTREQMAAFIVRALGLTDASHSGFSDVPTGSTFETDIKKLAKAGITRGCNPPANDRFCPEDEVSREQMAAFLVRALELTDGTGPRFVDVTPGTTFDADIKKLAKAGITKGCNPPTNDRFCPSDNVTREQMAAFMNRAGWGG